MRGYQIVDEPVPTRLGHLMTSPFWILLATMLGGTWLGWPWFVLNSLAIGSMHRRREIAAVVLGLVGSMALGAALFVAAERAYLDATSAPYTVTVLVVWKMLIAYLLLACKHRASSSPSTSDARRGTEC